MKWKEKMSHQILQLEIDNNRLIEKTKSIQHLLPFGFNAQLIDLNRKIITIKKSLQQ